MYWGEAACVHFAPSLSSFYPPSPQPWGTCRAPLELPGSTLLFFSCTYYAFKSDQFISSSIIFPQHCFKLVTPLKPLEICEIKRVKRGPPGNRAQLWQPGHGKSSPPFRMAGCTSHMSRMVELAPPTLWNSHLYFFLLFFLVTPSRFSGKPSVFLHCSLSYFMFTYKII